MLWMRSSGFLNDSYNCRLQGSGVEAVFEKRLENPEPDLLYPRGTSRLMATYTLVRVGDVA